MMVVTGFLIVHTVVTGFFYVIVMVIHLASLSYGLVESQHAAAVIKIKTSNPIHFLHFIANKFDLWSMPLFYDNSPVNVNCKNRKKITQNKIGSSKKFVGETMP